MGLQEEVRQRAIQRYLSGESPTAICHSLGRSRFWLFKWLKRHKSGQGDWFVERSRRRNRYPDRTPADIEAVVKLIRHELDDDGMFCGSQAIRWEMEERKVQTQPSLRTIGRILKRNDLTKRRAGRYQAKGVPYPQLPGSRLNETHQADWVGPLYLKGAYRFYNMNVVDLATGRCGLHPSAGRDGQSVLGAFWAVWSRMGIPRNVQVDNAMGFFGSPTHPRGMGPLIRLCLHNNVEPWFIPPAEPWRNGVVESFNEHYQQKFLKREHLAGEDELIEKTMDFENKHNSRARYSKLKGRTPLQHMEALGGRPRFPRVGAVPQHPLKKPSAGRYHVVRFIRSNGMLDVFGERFEVPKTAHHEYVIGTVDVQRQKLSLIHDKVKIGEYDYKLR